MTKRQIVILLTGLLIIFAGIGIKRLLASQKEAPERKKPEKTIRLVRVERIQTDTLLKRIPVTGKVIAAERVELFPEVTGTLIASAKAFKVGQHFDAGEPLLVMDGSESLLNLKAQRSAFINAVAQVLPDIKIDYAASYETWKAFFDAISPDKLLPALPEVPDSKLKNLLSGRNIFQQYYAVRSLENRQQKFVITAPFSGSVSMGNINPGTVLRAGQKAGEFIADDAFEFEAAIAAEDAAVVGIGAHVTLTGGLSGPIVRMARNVDPSTQRLTIYVRLQGSGIREGVYLDGVIETNAVAGAVRIDRNLILDDSQVFVVNDSVLAKKPVQIVHRYEEKAMVTGLSDGDVLLNQLIQGAYEGMLVKQENK